MTFTPGQRLFEIVNDKDITIRTSIIGPDMRPEGIGLFNWFMKSRGTIYGYTRVFWNGVTTLELAKLVEALLDSDTCGLVHFTNRNKISNTSAYNLETAVQPATISKLKNLMELFRTKALLIPARISHTLSPTMMK